MFSSTYTINDRVITVLCSKHFSSQKNIYSDVNKMRLLHGFQSLISRLIPSIYKGAEQNNFVPRLKYDIILLSP